MSDREFPGFDVDTVAEAVRQPALDDLWERARARRRRRTGGVALALVVAFAGTAVLPLAAGGGGPAGPDQPPVRPDRGGELFLTGPGTAVVAGVWAPDGECPTVRFRHTGDGGRTWTGDEDTRFHSTRCDQDAEGHPVGTPEFSVLGQRSYLVVDGARRWLSTDFGRTWWDAEETMLTVPAFPARARPVPCQAAGCAAVREPLAVDPTTGTVYRLGGRPPSPYAPFSVYPGADGTVWALYPPGGADQPVLVARSVDRGATWNTWRSAKGADVRAVLGVGAREAYLLIDPPPPPGAPPMTARGPVRLLRTTDGGRSFADVGTDLPDTPETLAVTLGADGSLLVAESDNYAGEDEPPPTYTSRLWASRDEGRHFERVRSYHRNDGAVGAAPGAAWLYGRDDMSTGGADHVLLTTDGKTWTRFPLPD